MPLEPKDSNIDPKIDDEPTIILSSPSQPMNIRTWVLQHALMLIGEPTNQSEIITTTLQYSKIETIMDLLTSPHSIIGNLSSLELDSKGRSSTKKLRPAQNNKVKVLQEFSTFTNKPNDPITLLKWMTITPKDFDSFQLHDYRPYDYGPLAPTPNAT